MHDFSIEQSIPAAIGRQVRSRPDAIAVVGPTGSLSYADLDRQANKVANGLIERLGADPEPVALLMDQGLDNVVAILGVLKAGKFYVSLDIRDPDQKLGAQMDHSRSRLLLSSRDLARRCAGLATPARNCLDMNALLDSGRTDDPDLPVSPDALAYLFFTSGSTGTPKGVIDCHRNVLHNIMRYTVNLGISPIDRLSMIQMPNFSGTVSSLFCALANGGTICPFPLASAGVEVLADWMNRVGVTVYHSVPSVFRALVATGQAFPSVRVVRLEGDQALPGDVALFRKNFGDGSILAVGLGATETGLSAQWILDSDAPVEVAGRVPVGHPTRDFAILVTDDDGNELAAGEPGEIRVRSRYLAVGYWQAPAAQDAAFLVDLQDPSTRTYRTGDRGRIRPDGCLEFLGRGGDVVKVNGEWIDPGEIEAALLKIGGISQAVVLVHEVAPGISRVAAHVVAEAGSTVDAAGVRRDLLGRLSPAMVPSSIDVLDVIPLTASGKVDRRALGRMSRAQRKSDPVPPADRHEEIVLGIWQEVLQGPAMSVLDNYFDIGGTSLQAAAIVTRLGAALGRRVSVNDLIRNQTVRELARHLRSGADGSPRGYLVPLQREAAGPTLFVIHEHTGSVAGYLHLARHLHKTCRSFGLQTADLDPAPVFGSIEEMARRYLDEIRSVQPDGPYNVLGFCIGGVIAFEIAHQLTAAGCDVGLLGLLGVSPYDFPNLVCGKALGMWTLHSDRSLRGKIRFHIARSNRFGPGEKGRYFAAKARSAWSNVWSRVAAGRSDASQAAGQDGSETERELKGMLTAIFRRYEARPFDGAVDLFLSGSSCRTYCDDPNASWSGLSTHDVRVHLADVCTDWDILREPHVRATALRVGEILNEAHAAHALESAQP